LSSAQAFLRIPGAANLLDNSSVHPESYHVVESMAKDCRLPGSRADTPGRAGKKNQPKTYISDSIGEYTIEDI